MVDQSTASSLLAESGALRRVAADTVTASWYAMLVFGFIALGSAAASFGPSLLGAVWWPVGAVVGAWFVTRFHRRRSAELGAVSKDRRSLALWTVVTVVAFVGSALAPPGAGASSAWAAIGVGYLILAALQRSPLAAFTGLAVAVASLVALSSPDPSATADGLAGTVLIVAGATAWRAENRW